MKLLLLPKYGKTGASSRYRSFNYLKYFDEAGLDYDVYPFFNNSYVHHLYSNNRIRTVIYKIKAISKRFFLLLFKSRNYDLIIIEKELFTNLPYFIEKFLLKNKAYALDFDDYVGAYYQEGFLKNRLLGSKINKLSEQAKFVTVGNNWYFDELKNAKLIYLPTVINLNKYGSFRTDFSNEHRTIVWIGSPSTVKYLEDLKPVFKRLALKYKFTLKVIGGEFSLKKSHVQLISWNSKTEVLELLDSHIGIMPLRDTLWEKGKCGFKLIQYMACGLPVIASPAPANEEIVEHGVEGYIANDSEQWYDYLEILLTDSAQCKKMGEEGRKRIEAAYTYQIWGEKYVQMILKSLENE